MANRGAVLYISYDGMLEPLGQSQVVGYLERLGAGRPIHLLSFEKKEDSGAADRIAAMRQRLAIAGIRWTPLAYHKTPTAPATAYDISVGSAAAISIAIRHRVRIVHARSYVAATIALAVKRMTGAKYLFDMRGFWADERVDGGLWPRSGRLYTVAKRMEKSFLKAADHVVTLTHASARLIEKFDYLENCCPPITVIPTCADLKKFAPGPEHRDGPFVLGYVGSVGTWYLFDDVLRCFKAIRALHPEARLLCVNRGEHDFIQQRMSAHGLDPAMAEITSADYARVPEFVRRMSVGAALIKPVFSKMASAPTKLAEYLGCGVPCLGNVCVGDMEGILEGEKVGIALRDFSEKGIEAAMVQLITLSREQDIAERCVATANKLFSLDVGVADYRSIYEQLAA